LIVENAATLFKQMQSKFTEVENTASDALICKLSCIQRKYYEDRFLPALFSVPNPRRQPLVNRGYWARVLAIDQSIWSFLTQFEHAQILNCGAGLSTTYFRLCEAKPQLAEKIAKFIDIDSETICTQKIAKLQKAKNAIAEFSEIIESAADVSTSNLVGPVYSIVSADLAEIHQVVSALDQCDLDFSLPTLLVSECVFIYMEPSHSDGLMQWATWKFDMCAVMIYEQIHPDDPFGRTMIENLRRRQLELRSFTTYPNQAAQEKRMLQNGFTEATCWSMKDIYTKFLDESELRRISRLEMFDEFEEFFLFMAHYCIAIGAKGISEVAFMGTT